MLFQVTDVSMNDRIQIRLDAIISEIDQASSATPNAYGETKLSDSTANDDSVGSRFHTFGTTWVPNL